MAKPPQHGFREYVKNPNLFREEIKELNGKEGGAEAPESAVAVHGPYEFVLHLYQRKGASGLTEPQLDYLTLYWLDAEVRNGGFSQYYFNSSGELAPYAVKAARSVGAPELAKIIQEANALFGKNGPDPDREKRMDQLSKIDLQTLGELDNRYYQCTENLSEILPRFVVNHPKDFK
ncbi:MAG: DMP19 family protein [Planctomycetes bacterium]|nr:DMP19 family protein [Planctomycetota bacterium]